MDAGRDLEEWGAEALAALTAYRRSCAARSGPVVTTRPSAELLRELDAERWLREGGMSAAHFRTWLDAYLGRVTRLHHPACMGHQVSAPEAPSAVADFINGVTNGGTAIREMAPPGVALERAVIAWMLRQVGWDPQQTDGVLTSGGSMANLTALLAARAQAAPTAWRAGAPARLGVLAPKSAHYSVARAVGILGLGADAVTAVATDACGRLLAEDLPAAAERARRVGRAPAILVVSACSTPAGMHDPLEAAGAFARAHGLWFHVDGAHGVSALLSPRLRPRLRGLELADSITWDAHKMLHVSSLCAAVLVRRRGALEAAFEAEAPYLGDPARGAADADPDPWHRTLECTRPVLALKLFLTLAAAGERGLARRIEALYDVTREMHRRLAARPGIEVMAEPESNILCFRVPGADASALRRAVLDSGSHYLSQTTWDGRTWLRLTVMNPGTEAHDAEELADRLLTFAGSQDPVTPTAS